MYLIEQMLTGQMKMSDFIILLKSDKSLQEIIRGFVPQEAIGNRSHAFWKEMSYDALLERNFNFLRLVTDLARFDGTIRDNLNIFTIFAVLIFIISRIYAVLTNILMRMIDTLLLLENITKGPR